MLPTFTDPRKDLVVNRISRGEARRSPWSDLALGAAAAGLIFALAGCSTGGGGAADGITCDPGAEASRTASCIEDFSPGEGAGFGEEAYPDIVYGEPQGGGVGKGGLDVLSLGRLGSITLGFGGGQIADGPGPDFIVFENAFLVGNSQKPFAELGEVSASEDGVAWVTFPCKRESYPFDGCAGWRPVLAGSEPGIDAFDPEEAGGDPFDLADVGLPRARFVRITDVSGAGAADTAGFDLDAVTVVNAL